MSGGGVSFADFGFWPGPMWFAYVAMRGAADSSWLAGFAVWKCVRRPAIRSPWLLNGAQVISRRKNHRLHADGGGGGIPKDILDPPRSACRRDLGNVDCLLFVRTHPPKFCKP